MHANLKVNEKVRLCLHGGFLLRGLFCKRITLNYLMLTWTLQNSVIFWL